MADRACLSLQVCWRVRRGALFQGCGHQRWPTFLSGRQHDAHYRKLYADCYAKLDPFTTSHFLAEIDEPIATADVMPYEEFRATRFYKEWVLPQGIVDNVTAALDKSGTSVALFTVFRHERDGRVDDEARRRMRLIAPHLRRAVLIGRVIDLKTAEASSFADTLDGIAAGRRRSITSSTVRMM